MLTSRALTAAAACAALALTGCAAGVDAAAPRPEPSVSYTADVPVLEPGLPGEDATVVAPGETGSVPNLAAYNDVDVVFVRDMVAHHAQALRMAELAPGRVGDQRVARLAERIRAAQGPEVAAMQGWLEGNGLPPVETDDDGHLGHDHGDDDASHAAMPGMASEQQLLELTGARAGAFDRTFLQLMTAHHRGALTMTESVLLEGSNVVISELASDINVEQTVEINRMQDLLAQI